MKVILQDIIEKVAEQAGVTKKLSEGFLQEFFDIIIDETLNKSGSVKIKGLGTFKLLSVEERKSVNVQTGEEIIIPQHEKISFVPEKDLKAAINKPYSHLETYILSKEGHVDVQESEDEDNEEANIDEGNVATEDNITVENNITVEENVQIEEREVEKIIITENSTKTNKDMEERENKNRKWIIIVILLIILGLVAWWWFSDSKQSEDEGTKKELQISPEHEIDEEVPVSDVIIDETQENRSAQKSEGEVKSGDEGEETAGSSTPIPNRSPEFQGEYMFDKKFDFKLIDFMQANYPNMKLITYGTPQKVTLEKDKRLTLLARDYYGDKRFWVYIYLYNTDIIKHPNRIPAGMVIKIPKLDKSLVDPNSKDCLDAAWDVQKYLLKM